MDKNIEEHWIKLQHKLKAFIISKVQNESVANDILNEVFIKIHNNIDNLKNKTKLQSWIYQITRNSIIDHFRMIKKENALLEYPIDDYDDNSSDDLMEEAVADMIKMMDELPPEYCEALCLTELNGLSQKEYAEKIGISYSGAKSRVQRARKKLKDNLMKCCHYQFDKYGTVLSINPANCCCCNS